MARSAVEQLIRQYAKALNLDAEAVLAVAKGEGGVRWGGRGDFVNGKPTSFGPFQLHIGGALPQGKGEKWANSPEGLLYAMQQMAEHSAGLRGEQAIISIIRRFERPANPEASIENALKRYSSTGATARVPAVNGNPSFTVGGPTSGPTSAQVSAAYFADAAKNFAQTGQATPNSEKLMKLVQDRKAAIAAEKMQAEFSAGMYGGTTVEDNPRSSGNSVVDRILAIAHAQVGKPYVWGGETPGEGGFDCSGLIDYAFKKAGIDLPGRLTTSTAMNLGKSVKGKRLRPGDWIITNGGNHMVMYVGNGKVIAAPQTGETVQYQPLSRFQGDIVDIRRFI